MNHFRPRVFFIISSILIGSFFGAASAQAASITLGAIPVSMTLSSAITYYVDGDVIVPAGVTLTIPAGTHLIFTAHSRLTVYGAIAAKGTASKHVIIKSGELAPYIPLFAPLRALPESSIQSPETQSPEIQSPEVQSAAVQSPGIEGETMHADSASGTVTHDGIELYPGAKGSFSYMDMSDARYGLRISSGTTAAVDHASFVDCDTAIMGITGGLKLTGSSFSRVSLPAEILFPFAFAHSENSFSNTDIKGWKISASMAKGDTLKLDSTDGEYYLPGISVPAGASVSISPGVTVFRKDGEEAQIYGKLTASGTADKPIVIYGDGSCRAHLPAFSFNSASTQALSHVDFKNLCNGIEASHTKIALSDDRFDTMAGTAVNAHDISTVTATAIAMHDVYQAFDVQGLSRLALSDATISQVNGTVPAINAVTQSPVSIAHSSISNASTCIAIMKNSSIAASFLTLAHCGLTGLLSDNDSEQNPSGITLTDSDISQSGTAVKLRFARVTDVSNNHFHGNAVGVSLADMPKTIIVKNGWGSSSGPRIASNPGGNGDSIVIKNVPEVLYRPWLEMDEPAAPSRNPVIIVPGITGSYLSKNYGDKAEIWPNIAKLALSLTDSFLEDLDLLPSGKEDASRPMSVGDIVRSISSTDVFSSMIASLEGSGYKEGTDLFVLPYDWRLSNGDNQALLAGAVANALSKSGKTKVNVIAHSMGGLLVKDYLAHHADAPIDRLFYIGVPHLGAPKAFQTLMYGDDMGFKFSIAGALQVPLLNADTVKSISQNMPSVYELLPAQGYISKFGSYIRDNSQPDRELSLDATKQLMAGDGRNAAMFPFAKSVHDATDTLDGAAHGAYDFVGCGSTKAVNSYTLSQKKTFNPLTGALLSAPEHRIYYANGDGVVPVKSASAGNGAKNYYVTTGSHGTLPAQPQVQQAILSILSGSPVVATSGISEDEKSCSVPGETVDVHSPVTLDIYDDQGRHTGPTATGEIEYGIPNVQYDVIGTEKFAFLPDGPTYKIVNHALAVGTYDMYVDHSDENDNIVHELYFRNVPVNTVNATATMDLDTDFEATGGNYQISMDEDGDGEAESNFYALYSFSGSFINDHTPPVTTASLDKNGFVTLSATDDLSRVEVTWYYVDANKQWRLYSKNATNEHLAPGATIKFFSIDYMNNVEDVKQLTAPSAAVTPPDPEHPPQDHPAVQTPATAPVTVNYGDTIINNPPATQIYDPLPEADIGTKDNHPEHEYPPGDATPSRTESPQAAAVTVRDASAVIVTPAVPAEPVAQGEAAEIADGSAAPLESLPPQQLLASAGIPAASGGTVLAASIAIVCALVGLYVAKRFYGSKRRVPFE